MTPQSHVRESGAGGAGLSMAESPDPALLARVAALRRLASDDVVPAIHDIVQLCSAGAEVTLNRKVAGPGRLVGYTKDVRLRFESPADATYTVSEAAVVFGVTAASVPATAWRGRTVVELGCGTGFVGALLAALGGRVVLTDLPRLESLVTGNITLNAPVIRSPAAASFTALDWDQPRARPAACAALSSASVIVAADPVVDAGSQQRFVALLHAMLGMDGEPAICRDLQKLIIAHKHQQSYCISGYTAPVAGARPTITDAGECDKCLFRRGLEDAGFVVTDWEPAPVGFEHPFIQCWSIGRRKEW